LCLGSDRKEEIEATKSVQSSGQQPRLDLAAPEPVQVAMWQKLLIGFLPSGERQ